MKKLSKIFLCLLAICLLAVCFSAAAGAEETDAYAVYNYADRSLTFVVGTKTEEGVVRAADHQLYTGSVYSGFLTAHYGGDSEKPWANYGVYSATNVTFVDPIAPLSTATWFSGFSYLTTINGIENLNTGNVTDMAVMFSGCSRITSLDLSSLDTGNVTDMSGMFHQCDNLTQLNVSDWDTGNVTDMSYMFSHCSKLTALDINDWDTGSVTDMSEMFRQCSSLTQLNINNWDTGNVTNTYNMFAYCYNLTSLDLNNWVTGNVTSMTNMFYLCSSLTQLNISGWDTVNVTSMWGMFDGCSNLTELDVSNWDTSNVTIMWGMFNNCYNLTELDLSNWDTGNVTTMKGMFNNCSLSSLTLGEHFSFQTKNALNNASKKYPCYGYWVRQGGDGTHYLSAELMEAYNGTTMAGKYIWNYSDTTGTYAIYQESEQALIFVKGAPTTEGVIRTDDGVLYSGDAYYQTNGGYNDYDLSHVPWSDICSNVTTVTFFDQISPETTANWFDGFSSLTTITGIENLDISNVTDLRYMFRGCTSLTELDLSSLNTGRVTNMEDMFSGCSGLTALNVSGWNTGRVTNMSYMFYGCSALTELDLSRWNTARVTNMGSMFEYCSGLTQLEISDWNTGSVRSMVRMFYGCSGLTELDLSRWNTASVTNMGSMFERCSGLTQLEISDWNTGNVTAMFDMFSGCRGLTSLDLNNWNTGNAKKMDNMFTGCSGLTELDVSSWNTGSVTTMSCMFAGCSSLAELDLSNWDTGSVTTMSGMFYNCQYLVSLTLGEHFVFTSNVTLPNASSPTLYPYTEYWAKEDNKNTRYTPAQLIEQYDGSSDMAGTWVRIGSFAAYNDTDKTLTFISGTPTNNGVVRISDGTLYSLDGNNCFTGFLTKQYDNSRNKTPWYSECANITNVTFVDAIAPMSTAYWFDGFSALTTITGIENLNTGNITDITYMFRGCSSLTELDLSSWNVGNVTNMRSLFYNCSSLTELNLSGWDTGNVTSMNEMFRGCSSLTELDLNSWNTGNVTTMNEMFKVCSSLTELDLSSWDTSHVTSMNEMFRDCSKLTELDVSDWNTGNVTNMIRLFSGCSKLPSLDISGWNTGHVTNMYDMFGNCSALAQLTLGEHFIFKSTNAGLPAVPDSLPHTGFWVKEAGDNTRYTSSQLMSGYDGANMAGTYEWETYETGTFAVFNETAQTLTFVFGTPTAEGVVREGVSYAGDRYYFGFLTNTYTENTIPWKDVRANVTTVTFLDPLAPTSTAYWFDGFYNLTTITGIENLNTGNVTNMRGMFNGCRGLTSLDLSNWNTGNVTDMAYMFNYCPALTNLDISGFNTASVTDMTSMFCVCSGLTQLDVSNWNTGNVTNMSSLFSGCSRLTELNVSNWDTGNVTSMGYMFYGCSGLTELDVSGWDTRNVTSMNWLFYNCSGLTQLNVSDWDTGKVTNMNCLFYYCSGLTQLDVSGWDTRSVTDMSNMFNGCSSLTGLDVSGWDTGVVTTTRAMFYYCSSLTELDLSNWNTGNVTDMNWLFYNCSALARLTLGEHFIFTATNVGLPAVPTSFPYKGFWIKETGDNTQYTSSQLVSTYDGTTMSGTYVWETYGLDTYAVFNETAQTLTFVTGTPTAEGIVREGVTYAGDRYYFDFLTNTYTEASAPWYAVRTNVTSVSFLDPLAPTSTRGWFYDFSSLRTITGSENLNTGNVTSMSYMFYQCSSLTGLDVSNWDTGKVTDMSWLFYKCSGLTQLDVSDWDTSHVTDMDCMFSGCSGLTELDVSDWKTGSATDMESVFRDCSGLTQLDVSDWDTSHVTDMDCMFYNCSGLTQLDVSDWDTGHVTSMGSMFSLCSSLIQLDVSGWDTGNVTYMLGMFSDCSSLTGLDLSGWDTGNVTDMSWLFSKCTSLTQLDVSSWNTGNVTTMSYMFRRCPVLSSLNLGQNFVFKDNRSAALTAIPIVAPYTGYWVSNDHPGLQLTSNDLMDQYNGTTMAGTWVWQRNIATASISGIDQVYSGEALTTTLTVLLENNTLIEGTDFTAVYTNNVNAGTARVNITGIGNCTGTASGSFTILPKNLSAADVNTQTQTYSGTALNSPLTVTLNSVELTNGSDFYADFTDNVNAGTATVTVTGVGNYTGTASGSFTILPKSLTGAAATGAAVTYNGAAQTTTLTVVQDNLTLTEGTDFTVGTYSDNVNAGTATVNISGIGNYTGDAVGTFTVLPKPLSNAAATGEIKTYNGEAQTTDLTVTLDDVNLVEGTDFTIGTYTDNVNAGTATVNISGIGNYTGNASGSFTILPKPLTGAAATGTAVTYNGAAQTTTLTVVQDNLTLTEGTDFTVGAYSDNVNAGTATVNISGIGNYTGEAVGTFTVLPKSLAGAAATGTTATYNGAAQTTDLTVTLDDINLVEGTDFTIGTYTDNVNAGTATVTVSGIGNYTGNAQGSFTILPKNIDFADINGATSTYNGEAQTPDLTVTIGDMTLAEGTDFTAVYDDNTNAGLATVTINGVGNFTGETMGSFTILPKNIDFADATGPAVTYNGEAQTTNLTVTLDGVTLTEGTDFTVEGYENNVNAGTARVKLAGINNYGGETLGTFTIQPKALTGAQADGGTVTYTGDALTTSFTVTLDDTTLAEGTDFTVTYENNVNAGTATATIEGVGNYKGAVSGTFTILAKDLSDATIDTTARNYTGEAITEPVTVELDGRTLTEGTDYTVIYEDNVEEGTAKVTVTGIGNYTGTVFGSFEIKKDDLTDSKQIISQLSLLELLKKLVQKIIALFRSFC